MKLFYFFFAMVIFNAQTPAAIAQKIPIEQNRYNAAVDYLNCKLVDMSLQSMKDQSIYKQFVKECNCKTPDAAKIQAFLQKNKQIEATLKLSNQLNDLKKNYNKKWSRDTVVELLSKNIFYDKANFKETYLFGARRRNTNGEDFDRFQKQIEASVYNIVVASNTDTKDPMPNIPNQNQDNNPQPLAENNNNPQPIAENTNEPQPTENTNNAAMQTLPQPDIDLDQNATFDFTINLPTLILAFLMCLGTLLYTLTRKIQNDLNPQDKDWIMNKIKGAIAENNQNYKTNTTQDEDIKRLKTKIIELEQKLKK